MRHSPKAPRLIYVVDNGKHYSSHCLAYVRADSEHERKALRHFGALLKVDPFRQDPGITLVTPEGPEHAGLVVAPADLFEGPEAWPVQLYSPSLMSDEHLRAVLRFSAAWPAQRNVDPAALAEVRQEGMRRAFGTRRGPAGAAPPDAP